jgi:ankyrin repeat protein
VSGRPGTGKSTLLDSMLEDSTIGSHSDRATFMASFFFHRRGDVLQYSPLGLFRSLLHQLLTRDKILLAKFATDTKFEERCKCEGEPGLGKKWDWTESDMRNCFTECLQAFLRDRTLWLYIDGLDESGETHARDVWNYLKEQLEQSGGRLNVCISCRPYPDVVFSPDYCITVDDENQGDIATYLQSAFNAEQRWRSRADLEEIQDTLKTRACGVFQWVVIVTADMLRFHWESKNFIVTKIQKAPTELSDLYQDMLKSVVQKNKEDGLQVLQILRWITFAQRPLSLTELRYAVATKPNQPLAGIDHCKQSENWCNDDDTMADRIRTLSQGLVRVVNDRDNKKTVEFDHESVKEYVLKGGIKFLEDETGLSSRENEDVVGRAHHILYGILIRHLPTQEASNLRAQGPHHDLPMLDYAIAHWMTHAKIADDHGRSLKDIVDLTEWPSDRTWVQWKRMHEIYGQYRDTTLQHVAARYGLYSVLDVLVARCKSRKAKKLRQTLNLLSRREDDIDAKDGDGLTPLSWAAEGGHEGIVKMLLATGKVNADSKDDYGRKPLALAMQGRHEGIVKMLLATGKVNADSKNDYGRTPLSWAAEGGHEGIVKMLLATGKVDVDSKDKDGRTPLSYAASNGKEATVKQLLETGKVDVDSKDKDGRTPLTYVASNGKEATVKQLLETGKVDVDSKDNYGRTPLSYAASSGKEATVKQLLETGKVDVDSKDNYGRTPLSYTAQGGHESIAVLLVNKMTPVAAAESSVMVARLNSSPSRPDCTPDTLGRTPYMWAALEGKVSCIQSLWPSSLPTSSSTIMDKDSLGLSLIHFFAIGNCSDGISLVLDAGFNVNEPDSQGWTPLHWAAYFGHKEVCEFLVDRVADKGLKDSTGRTAYAVSLFVGAKQLNELLKPHLVQDNPNVLEVAQDFSAYCDSCQRVSAL